MGKRKDGLTAKQRHFALELATNDSGTLTSAYETAYECSNMSRAAMRNEASKLMSHPDIAAMVESIRSENEAKKLQSLRALELNDRERVLSKLREWIDTAEPTDTNRIAAARLLGQSISLFKEHTITEEARSSDDIARQLEDRLANLLEGSDNEGVTEDHTQESVH